MIFSKSTQLCNYHPKPVFKLLLHSPNILFAVDPYFPNLQIQATPEAPGDYWSDFTYELAFSGYFI